MSDERASGGCGRGAGEGCASPGRRSFMVTVAGVSMLGSSLIRNRSAIAGPFGPQDTVDHFVPADKKLDQAWVDALFARGEPAWYQGDDLATIGMPVGGIGAGQVYLTGDGRLVYWDVFNEDRNTGYGSINYTAGRTPIQAVHGREFEPANDVAQGAAVRVRQAGRMITRRLDASGFPAVRFRGAYPVGRAVYEDDGLAARIELTACSPFIPLEAEDSALPATILSYEIVNTSAAPISVTLDAWLENAAMIHSAAAFGDALRRTARVIREDGFTAVAGAARMVEKSTAPTRAPIVFADFEGEDYGAWTTDGDALGDRPATGTLENQQRVSGFSGHGLVNTFLGGDRPTGRLVSPPFTIDRPWIGFLIGGGSQAGHTCMNLVVDGATARTATGRDNERLRPESWDVRDLAGRTAHLEIVDDAGGAWGHVNVDRIEFRDDPMPEDLGAPRDRPDWGTMAIAVLGPDGNATVRTLGDLDEIDAALGGVARRGPDAGNATIESGDDQRLLGFVSRTVTLAPGARATVPVVVAWHFPNLQRSETRVGHRYAQRFLGAADVARHVAANYDRLAGDTLLWQEVYEDSTLPFWLLDRVAATTCNLATTTCQWWRNGRFWAYEGGGCCHGTCGHVWNYAHAMARLFPALERSVREMQDLAPGIGFDEKTGAIAFRGEGWGLWAGDAQGGYLLKAWREHLCSADDAFLDRNWRFLRKAIEFLIEQDGDGDGLLEGRQHNTYDIDYYGANTMVGSLYLGALRAAEEMAREVGDEAFAQRCREIFEAGSANTMRRLFDGEYFVQDVDLAAHPEWQYARGCLADQLFGQSWAHQVNLGYLYPQDAVRSALKSIWTYDWAPDVRGQNDAHRPERWFAMPGEAGLFTCTWPKSRHLGPRSTRYRNEVWTGIEYQVASHMAWEGMVEEALAICRAVHERYHPSRRNPYNEVECGDHYARAMASWGVLIGLAGFEYHGPRGHLGFAPRLTPDDFKSVFTAAEGWGSIGQRRAGGVQTNYISVRHGRLRLKSLALAPPANALDTTVTVTIDGAPAPATPERDGERVVIHLPREVVLEAGGELRVEIGGGEASRNGNDQPRTGGERRA